MIPSTFFNVCNPWNVFRAKEKFTVLQTHEFSNKGGSPPWYETVVWDGLTLGLDYTKKITVNINIR